MSSAANRPRNPEQPAVRLNDVQKRFAGNLIIKGVSLDVPRHGLTLITGHSGSGKSTLLRMMAGIEEPDEGRVALFGQDLYRMGPKQRKKLVGERIGISFQAPLLDAGLSVGDNVRLPSEARGHAVSAERLAELAYAFGMETKLGQPAGTLSGGEQFRTSMMRAAVNGQELLLLDEPTSAIDPDSKPEIFDLIRNYVDNRGVSAVLVTHEGDMARQYADREIVVESGLVTGSAIGQGAAHGR